MKSERPKVLHPVAWRPMIAHVLDAAAALSPERRVIVVGHRGEEVKAAALATAGPGGAGLEFVEQREQRGTGHAVREAKEALAGFDGTVLVLPGDVPLVRAETLLELLEVHAQAMAPVTVLTTMPADATGYGRIVRDPATPGRIAHRRASRCRRSGAVDSRDQQRLHRRRRRVSFLRAGRARPAQRAGRALPHRRRRDRDGARHAGRGLRARAGVGARRDQRPHPACRAGGRAFPPLGVRPHDRRLTVLDPSSVRIDPRARIGADTILGPRVEIRGRCIIGEECTLDTGSVLDESFIGRGVTVRAGTA